MNPEYLSTGKTKKRRKPKRREKPFCTDLVKALKEIGWAFKIPDSPSSWGNGTKLRFTPKKAIDIVCTGRGVGGQLCAVECKMWTLKQEPTAAHVCAELQNDQAETLEKIQAAGGLSFVAVKRYIPRHSEFFLVRFNVAIVVKHPKIRSLAERIVGGSIEDMRPQITKK